MNLYVNQPLYYTIFSYMLAIGFIIWITIEIKSKNLEKKQKLTIIILVFASIFILSVTPNFVVSDFEFFYKRPPVNSIRYWTELGFGLIQNLITFLKVFLPSFTMFYFLYNTYYRKKTKYVDNQVDEFINKVFSEEKFYTAFATTLPKGKDDEQYGIDYIPFMLQTINNNKKRAKLYADRFLIATILLGLVFISSVVYFAYLLVNDSSTGISANVSKLKDGIDEANANFFILNDKDLEPV